MRKYILLKGLFILTFCMVSLLKASAQSETPFLEKAFEQFQAEVTAMNARCPIKISDYESVVEYQLTKGRFLQVTDFAPVMYNDYKKNRREFMGLRMYLEKAMKDNKSYHERARKCAALGIAQVYRYRDKTKPSEYLEIIFTEDDLWDILGD